MFINIVLTYSYVPNAFYKSCTLDNLCCCHPSLLPFHCFCCHCHQLTSSNLRLIFVVVCCSPPLYYFCVSYYQKRRWWSDGDEILYAMSVDDDSLILPLLTSDFQLLTQTDSNLSCYNLVTNFLSLWHNFKYQISFTLQCPSTLYVFTLSTTRVNLDPSLLVLNFCFCNNVIWKIINYSTHFIELLSIIILLWLSFSLNLNLNSTSCLEWSSWH